MIQKYDERMTGKLSLDEFSRLVTEFKEFESKSNTPETRQGPAAARNPQPGTASSYQGSAAAASAYQRDQRPQPTGYDPHQEATKYSDVPVPKSLSEEEAARLEPPKMPLAGPPEDPPANMPLPHGFGHEKGGSKKDGGNARERARSATRERSSEYPTGGSERERDPSGGVFGEHEGLGSAEDAKVLSLLAEYAGGKTLHPSQKWVVRAMRALELRYQAAARTESVQRYNLELHAHQLAHDLGAHQAALREAEAMRRQADADHERAREAMENEKQLALALKQHNTGLLRERDALVDELEHSQGQIRSLKREVQALQARWQTASNEAGEWAQRAYEAQGETRQALAEANEARNASSAMQRSLLSAQEYRLSEEAGYQLQTIIQMAPSKATLTTVYEQPQTVDAYVQM